jgi:uncharacterized membrane protein HdeD (DUF308 family)
MEGKIENADQDETYRNAWFYTLVLGLISTVTGLILFIFPTIGMVFISLIFSFYLIWLGISQIVIGYKLSSIQKNWWILLLRGIIMLILGFVVISFPISFAKVGAGVPLVLTGLFLIFYGVQDLISKHFPGSGINHTLSSIMIILTGALLCFAPVSSALIIFRLLGLTTFTGGILHVIRALYNRNKINAGQTEI